MDAYELAYFTDMMLAIEYPLYAHMVPGQRMWENGSKEALLAQISVGEEAAMAQKQETARFKKAISRISVDKSTRVITVTFKSKQEAKRWTNWKMPMANRLLTLLDYEGQRERVHLAHEAVKLDVYSFTTEVRKGKCSSRDMYWLLADTAGLQVHMLSHTIEGEMGMNDKQWMVQVRGAECPAKLKDVAFILVDDTEVVIHHHEVNVNWPCRRCFSTEYPTKYCRLNQEDVKAVKAEHVLQLNGTLPSPGDQLNREYNGGKHPTTLAELDAFLERGREKSDQQPETDPSMKKALQKQAKQTSTSNAVSQSPNKPPLPKEWVQQKKPVQQQRNERKRAEEQLDREEKVGQQQERDDRTYQATKRGRSVSPEKYAVTLPAEEQRTDLEEEKTPGGPDDVDRDIPTEQVESPIHQEQPQNQGLWDDSEVNWQRERHE